MSIAGALRGQAIACRLFSCTIVNSRSAAPLGLLPPLPVRNEVLAHIEVAGEYRLRQVLALADSADLGGLQRTHRRQARLVELAHGLLVDRADLMQRLHRFVDRRERLAPILLLRHSLYLHELSRFDQRPDVRLRL